jgi:hypothetical protein
MEAQGTGVGGKRTLTILNPLGSGSADGIGRGRRHPDLLLRKLLVHVKCRIEGLGNFKAVLDI